MAEGTTQRGPFGEHELVGAGLRPETLVWREGMSQWQPAEQLPELQSLFSTQPQPAAGPAPAVGYATPPFMAPYATYPAPGDISGKKIAAGICGLLIGTFGIHKFVAGLTGGAVTMLTISLVSLALGFLTCGLTWFIPPIMHVIGMIEGIIYLTKSDAEFYQVYMVQKRQWF